MICVEYKMALISIGTGSKCLGRNQLSGAGLRNDQSYCILVYMYIYIYIYIYIHGQGFIYIFQDVVYILTDV